MRIKREERQEYIKLWSESGLSKVEFCRKMGLAYSTFLAWVSREHGVKVTKQAAHIVPVRIIQESEYGGCGTYVVLRFKAYAVQIMPGFPESELKKILEMLGS